MDGKMRFLLLTPLVFMVFCISCTDKNATVKFDLLRQQNKIIETAIGVEYNAIERKLESEPEIAKAYGVAMNQLGNLKLNQEAIANEKRCLRNLEGIKAVLQNNSVLTDFDVKQLDSALVYENAFSYKESELLVSNIFLRNKLTVAKHLTNKLADLFFTDVKISTITHTVENKEVVVEVVLTDGKNPNRTVLLRNISINKIKQADRESNIEPTKQIVKINLGALPIGKHQFDCVLKLIRNEMPKEYTINYEFEL